jgi:hypothetical protein
MGQNNLVYCGGSALPSPTGLHAGRSKAFSPACLFRFSESSLPCPNYNTISQGGEGGGDVKLLIAFLF